MPECALSVTADSEGLLFFLCAAHGCTQDAAQVSLDLSQDRSDGCTMPSMSPGNCLQHAPPRAC
ncbi:hypothetical protein CKO38_06125 [Rhodospirillum rubrum]|nr:hypothetical protein [Rhodospirillum rubrum]MBK1676256.1 hypothetical protein [Rhodospirillum rubrum]